MSEYWDQFYFNIPMDTPQSTREGASEDRAGTCTLAVGSVTGYAVLVVLNFATGDSLRWVDDNESGNFRP